MRNKQILKILLIVSIFFYARSVWADMSKTQSVEIFHQANQEYQHAQYDSAIEKYEKILNEGLQSAAVYYNLANAYKKNEMLGKAILNYERALLIKPRDADINANFKFVLTEARISRKDKEANFIQKLFDKHINFYSLDEMFIMIFVFIFLIGGVILYKDKFSKSQSFFSLLLVAFSSLCIVNIFGFIAKYNEFSDAGIILIESDVKYEPREEAVVHYHMRQGERVRIVKNLGGWVKVERKDKKLGWIEKEMIEKIL